MFFPVPCVLCMCDFGCVPGAAGWGFTISPVAVAIHSDTPIVVTFNLRPFGPEHLKTWGICAIHPQSFLI